MKKHYHPDAGQQPLGRRSLSLMSDECGAPSAEISAATEEVLTSRSVHVFCRNWGIAILICNSEFNCAMYSITV
jgi:hypothetical protein